MQLANFQGQQQWTAVLFSYNKDTGRNLSCGTDNARLPSNI